MLLAVTMLDGVGGPAAQLHRASAQTTQPPNILIIMTDDQSVRNFIDDVMPTTKAWFADGGTDFTNAIVSTPYCCPSRASMFSGLYAHNHGVKRNNGGAFKPAGSIQDRLKSAGYTNAMYGKYLNNVTSNPPYFDDWATFPDSSKAYIGGTWNVDGTQTVVSQYSTDFITSRVHSFLTSTETNDAQPWFVVVCPPAPHPHWVVQDKYIGATVPNMQTNPAMFESDTSDKPPWIPRTISVPCEHDVSEDGAHAAERR